MSIFEAARNLTPEARKRIVRIAAAVAVLDVLLVVAVAFWFAARVVPAESPVWEAALQLRLVLVRLLVAAGLIPLGVWLGTLALQVVEKTELGRRLWTWAPADTDAIRAEKMRNVGNYLNLVTVALVVGLLLGVLR